MIIKILFDNERNLVGLSDNGELYELKPTDTKVYPYHEDSEYIYPEKIVPLGYRWSHVCSSPDDREKPYFDGKSWQVRNKNV